MAGKKLVILGGGFGGLDVARAVGRSRGAREYWDTLLIDKENFFQFNPLLPAVAVGAVETRHIVYPLREMARLRQIRFHKNKVLHIDLDQRRVFLHNNLMQPFDVLVIALGSVTNYYGVPGAFEYTYPFKTIADAMTLRARIIELFEMAEQAESTEQRRRLLSFAVVGGGITGVEVAAEMMEMVTETLLPNYPSIHRSHVSVTVLEGSDRLVPSARPEHSLYIQRHLERRGVAVRLGTLVRAVEPKRVLLADGGAVNAFTILWTAGVCPPAVVRELSVQHIPDGRIQVDAHLRALSLDGRPLDHVRVIGDSAAFLQRDGRYQAPLAATAAKMGGYVGRALAREADNRSVDPFHLEPVGYIISLGKHSSVVNLFGVRFSGRLAWLVWAAAYLIKMVGIRKQIEVGLDHLTHVFFRHDSSQILARRAILSDEELNLSLNDGAPDAESGAEVRLTGAVPR
jgi:NADH dehydrogenase